MRKSTAQLLAICYILISPNAKYSSCWQFNNAEIAFKLWITLIICSFSDKYQSKTYYLLELNNVDTSFCFGSEQVCDHMFCSSLHLLFTFLQNTSPTHHLTSLVGKQEDCHTLFMLSILCYMLYSFYSCFSSCLLACSLFIATTCTFQGFSSFEQ